MPRRNSIKDSIKIYYAYRVGLKDNTEIFSGIMSTTAIVYRSGESSEKPFGTDASYDLNVIINDNDFTHYIDEYTRIWVNIKPIDSNTSPDYVIAAEPKYANGQIRLACNGTSVNEQSIFYVYNGEILSFNAFVDYDKNLFRVKSNKFLPIDYNTVMWYIEPDNIDDLENRIKITKINKSKSFTEYIWHVAEILEK